MRVPFVCRLGLPAVVSILAAFSFTLGLSQPAAAATLTVCATGCAYSDFQQALNASQPGDTILLRAGETFIGNFVLPAKSGSNTSPILIRSDAPDSDLPAAGIRLVPPGYSGANVVLNRLARLKGRGGAYRTTPVLKAAASAHNYRLQFLDIDGVAQEGWGTLVEWGNNSDAQTTLDVVPYGIVLDRVYVHGHATKGQKRCIALNGASLDVLNSFVAMCAAVEIDAQAIAGFNGPGPFKISNNYLEGSTENILFGGADPKIPNLVPSDITITRNLFTKPVRWRNPVLVPPSAPAVTSIAGGGSLAATRHYFTVVAVMKTEGDEAVSARSAETSVLVGTSGSKVTLTWSAVSGADFYRVYRGTSAGGENRYMQSATGTTSIVYTGSGETTGTPPTQGKKWNVKNLLELKNARRVLIDGNIFEHSWAASQKGYAILLTPRNQSGTAPWSVVRDVTLTNNVIRHVAGAIVILGTDYEYPSQRTTAILIRNNLVYDVSSTWGSEHFLLMTGAPVGVTVDHNTIHQEKLIILADGDPIPSFVLTNNIAPQNQYGILGSGAGFGNDALAAYFPNAIVRRNAIGGANPSLYPPDNFYPDMTTFNAQFMDVDANDFRLVAGSIFNGKGTDGRNLGVDFAALDAAMKGAAPPSGDTGGGSVPPPSGNSAPFGGTPTTLPATIQAENFDEGGSGVAYHDTTSGNAGGQYRGTDVDIQDSSDSGGGHNVGWVAASEWLKYTVNVSAAAAYDIEVRVASAGSGGTFHIEVNGSDITGRLTVPNTGGWQSWTTVRKSGVSLNAGQQVWRLVMDTNGPTGAVGNFNYIRVTGNTASVAYGGTAASLPGTIQAENFDTGAAGVAYVDTSPGNYGGQYRGTDVDIESSTDSGGGYDVGWVAAGERLNYSVNVSTAGTYDIDVRVSSAGGGGTFHIEVNGVDKTGRLTVPNTGGWQTWTTVRKSAVNLSAGPQVWRLVMDTTGATGAVGNFNYIRVTGQAVSSPFGGMAVALPGVIQAENFDDGGAGRGYVDASAGNSGGQYRTTDVDIERTSDSSGSYDVGWVSAGEWLNYTVNVATAGTYNINVRVASPSSGASFHIEVNGVDKTGRLSVPNTGGWQTWTTVQKAGISLPAGPQTWRLVMDTNGSNGAVGNFNYISVTGPN
jgi:carbohydrate binding protein with CBM6 domain